MKQEFITIAMPFAARSEWNPLREADIVRLIEELGNPAVQALRHNHDGTGLDDLGIIHFMSINVVGATQDDPASFILIEATVDGKIDDGIIAIERSIGDELFPIVAAACGLKERGDLLGFLLRHSHKLSYRPFRLPGKLTGFGFLGTPGLSVDEIRRNHEIFRAARNNIHRLRGSDPSMGPQTIFGQVHDHVLATDRLRVLMGEAQSPLSFAETAKAPWLNQIRRPKGVFERLFNVALPLLVAIWVPLLLLNLLFASWAEWENWPKPSLAEAGHALMVAIFPSIVLLFALLGLGLWLLRRSELANTPQDIDPDPASLAEMMSRENHPGSAQNHMISTTIMVPGLLRRLLLMFSFYGTAEEHRVGVLRAGFLENIGTIHSARWLILPGTNKLVFLSNYGGSWESYLEDFITKVTEGVTSVWSNTIGFPATRFLLFGGARDGDRFKRFARRSMKPTSFWYSAYPQLTCEQIRKHAIVVSGLHNDKLLRNSPLDAEAWLDQFSTIPRPEYGLEYDEIQALMFGGLKRHEHSACLPINFGPPRASGNGSSHPYGHVQEWLAALLRSHEQTGEEDEAKGQFRAIIPRIDFGDKPPPRVVTNIAFSASGLRKMGLETELDISANQFAPGPKDPQGFPLVFAAGMTHPSRKRILSDPGQLEWSDDSAAENGVDAVLLIYAASKFHADQALDQASKQANKAGIGIDRVIHTKLEKFDSKNFYDEWHYRNPELPQDPSPDYFNQAYGKAELTIEPFGFVDGISQPKVRGFPGKHGEGDPIHDVEPGEFILGYNDNRGYFPPSPLLAPPRRADGVQPAHLLPYAADDQPQRFSDFGVEETDFGRPRDFGRNGSYLVIRQLAQNVQGFDDMLMDLRRQVWSKFDQNKRGPNDIETLNPHLHSRHRTKEWIAAKFVGRWRNGSSLVANPNEPAFGPTLESQIDNEFLFKDVDPQGLRCPLGSHIRRTFPRDSLAPDEAVQINVTNRHRLLRRGRPYLDPNGKLAGTLFMCFNADIERQFEFVQQTWMGSPTFHGLDGEIDPFAMHKLPDDDAKNREDQLQERFTVQGPAAPLCFNGVQSFVELKGGGYFFMPGRHALRFLAGEAWLGGSPPPTPLRGRGKPKQPTRRKKIAPA